MKTLTPPYIVQFIDIYLHLIIYLPIFKRFGTPNGISLVQNVAPGTSQEGAGRRYTSLGKPKGLFFQRGTAACRRGTAACRRGKALCQQDGALCRQSKVARQRSNPSCRQCAAVCQRAVSLCRQGKASCLLYPAACQLYAAYCRRRSVLCWQDTSVRSLSGLTGFHANPFSGDFYGSRLVSLKTG
jgi:hypothetical protein